MSAPSGKEPAYQVHWSKAITHVLRELHRQASERGMGEQFLSAARALVERLGSDPLGFGEACYHLPALELEVRTGIIAPVFVSYGVQREKRLVFVKEVKLLPGVNP
jgi:hypothetical protein